MSKLRINAMPTTPKNSKDFFLGTNKKQRCKLCGLMKCTVACIDKQNEVFAIDGRPYKKQKVIIKGALCKCICQTKNGFKLINQETKETFIVPDGIFRAAFKLT